jgi:hypothetical protein
MKRVLIVSKYFKLWNFLQGLLARQRRNDASLLACQVPDLHIYSDCNYAGSCKMSVDESRVTDRCDEPVGNLYHNL